LYFNHIDGSFLFFHAKSSLLKLKMYKFNSIIV
jgi:hypothetical protein